MKRRTLGCKRFVHSSVTAAKSIPGGALLLAEAGVPCCAPPPASSPGASSSELKNASGSNAFRTRFPTGGTRPYGTPVASPPPPSSPPPSSLSESPRNALGSNVRDTLVAGDGGGGTIAGLSLPYTRPLSLRLWADARAASCCFTPRARASSRASAVRGLSSAASPPSGSIFWAAMS